MNRKINISEEKLNKIVYESVKSVLNEVTLGQKIKGAVKGLGTGEKDIF